MNRRLVSFLIAVMIVLGGLSGCRCPNNNRVGYVPPPPGTGTCDRCAANGPLPPRYVPNTGPVPAGPAPVAVPFSPGAVPPPPGPAAIPSSGIQQNNYIAPGSSPAPSPPVSAPGAYLEQPEPAASNSGSPMPSDTRSYTPQTQEPPPARDDRNASPAMPVDIPQFAMVKANIASGQEPFSGGVAWLKSHGYRAVLHIRAPGEDDSAARRAYEQSGLRYVSLEVSPQTLSRAIVDQFNQLVADANNLPLFVYDKDGSLAGGLWYLYFRLVDRATEEKARTEAERLGFRQERSDAHLKMWLAVQNLLKDLKP
ncbi:MAG TPA: hypothetical protein VE999_17995 [Gemmataceae bacterium]|nr:hypothetical protein [Gemmataceae bacterium]